MPRDCRVYLDDILAAVDHALAYTEGYSLDKLRDDHKTLDAVVRNLEIIGEAAEKLYPHWRKNFEEWEKTGSDRGYHYLGSAIWFNRIGKAMGEAMLKMLPK